MNEAEFKKEIEGVRKLLRTGPPREALKKLREIEESLGDPVDSYEYARVYSLFSAAFSTLVSTKSQ